MTLSANKQKVINGLIAESCINAKHLLLTRTKSSGPLNRALYVRYAVNGTTPNQAIATNV